MLFISSCESDLLSRFFLKDLFFLRGPCVSWNMISLQHSCIKPQSQLWHGLPCTWTYRFPVICQSFTKSPMDSAFLSFSFQIFFISVFFAPSVITASRSCNIKQLPLIIFNKCPWIKDALHWVSSESGQIKTCIASGVSQDAATQPFKWLHFSENGTLNDL